MLTASAPFAVAADVGSFPTSSCSVESPEQKHKDKYNEFALGELASVLDSCAFGDRLNDIVSGALSSLFSRLDSINFSDSNFFCGFGTQDVWRIATTGTSAEGTRNFNRWRRQMVNETKREVGSYGSGWSRGGARYQAVPDNLFEEIFGASQQNQGNPNGN